MRLRSAIESFADDRGIVLDASQTIMSDNINFRDAGLPSVNFTSSYFLTTNIAHTNMDTHEVLSIPQILRLSDIVVDLIASMGNSVFGETDDDNHNIEIDEDDEILMFEKFEVLIDRLRDGEDVRFYDEFYVYFPTEGQYYFSYYEAVEHEERLAYIRNFGEYKLKFIRGGPDNNRRAFTYFNSENPNTFDLSIQPITGIEAICQANEIIKGGCLLADYTEKTYWENLVKMSLSRYFVMYAISQKPMRGYDISKWIGEVTKGCCCPTEGSLYPMLKEFESGGYVTSETMTVSGRERKVYTLTKKGLEAFNVGKEVWGHTAKLLQDSIRQMSG